MRKVNDYKEIKICCYGMGASEPEAFIDRWLDSMSGADYITYLVTKTNDPNFAYLKEKQKDERYKDKLIIAEEDITPWRFDTARNESMKLIPSDSDIIISTDIDEVMDESFWDDYRKCAFAHPSFRKILYKYAWSHMGEGKPGVVYFYDKATQLKGWSWERPVHESLKCDCENEYRGTYRLNEDKIYLHHYPDDSKSRGNYLGLLELRVKEDKSDIYGLYYLMREYTFRGAWNKSLIAGLGLYEVLLAGDYHKYGERAKQNNYLIGYVCDYIGNSYYHVGLRDEACYFYKKGIELDPALINNYIDLAQLLVYMGKPDDALDIMKQGDENIVLSDDWRDLPFYRSTWKREQILAGAYCWKGDYEKTAEHLRASTKGLTKEECKDADRRGFFTDYMQLKETCEKNRVKI